VPPAESFGASCKVSSKQVPSRASLIRYGKLQVSLSLYVVWLKRSFEIRSTALFAEYHVILKFKSLLRISCLVTT
jgi:hypothetical protein